ncbi:hypothetical protein M3G18_02095 [Corynebacterium sp. p3-SID1145]|uniref:hypothetical protein n=1 Tax=unclassified Corynebacterium TaxID=2624378 RepID=UPI0021AA9AA3|nr:MULTISPECIES: hypothetical protein [unclassified Corynebacterium]MCT1451707.1 hypothetical protein [Corynebacterium sp. p3-SID1145]MCT1460804.1 hypothetical protein [Corynebacterium sp. p3-SID1140]
MKPRKAPDRTVTLRNNMDVSGLVHTVLRDEGVGTRVSRRFFTTHPVLRPLELAGKNSLFHPRKIVYRVPAAARAVAMALERPDHSVGGMSALAVYGLRYFVDACDVALYGPVAKTELGSVYAPSVFRDPKRSVWIVRYHGQPIRISPPYDALIQALKHVRRGFDAWQIHPVPGLDARTVRAVQLVDACRRRLNLDPSEIESCGKQRLAKRWLRQVLKLSSDGADSPKETEMRLLCSSVCRTHGLDLEEQVVLERGGKIITVFDLALSGLKIGIMYDGEDHLRRSRRDRDSRINMQAAVLGWTVLRVGKETLASVGVALDELIRIRT